jgi:hypothetical protein
MAAHAFRCRGPHVMMQLVSAAGLLDFYLVEPLSKALGPKYSERSFTLRDRLGSGNYGQGEACVVPLSLYSSSCLVQLYGSVVEASAALGRGSCSLGKREGIMAVQ